MEVQWGALEYFSAAGLRLLHLLARRPADGLGASAGASGMAGWRWAWQSRSDLLRKLGTEVGVEVDLPVEVEEKWS